jgi:tRNA dimethylallyltransferase
VKDLAAAAPQLTTPYPNGSRIVAIVGPTASGKTALSIALAEALGGAQAVEVISADAMQLYRGMNIGTAKITDSERHGIAHHQLDVLDIDQEASAAAYQRHARADLAAIVQRGKIPLIVGGSGLYVSALLDELDFPGHSAVIRSELERIAATEGLEPLREELAQKDLRAYQTIDLHNPRRVIRALEVIRLTGRPYTPRFPRHTSHFPSVVTFGVFRDKDQLTQAIERRTRSMFETGLLDETRELLSRGLREAPTARRATGYAEAIEVIDGTMDMDEAMAATACATRRLAKKQRTWFRADPRITWLDLTDGDIARAARLIVDTVAG